MIALIRNFFKPANFSTEITGDEMKKQYKRLRWSVFLSATFGYGLYYVCRLSLNVIKKPLINGGYLTESQLGVIGSALFFSYAVGKLTNGFLADRSNIKKFMATGLLISALINLTLGFTSSFILFALLWGVNGWFQSMGPTPAIISITRWFSNKERGTFYGFFSTSHNIGEATTFIVTALLVTSFGWRWGFWGAGLIGLLGVVIISLFLHDSPQSKGLPSIAEFKKDIVPINAVNKSVGAEQLEVLKNPFIWILALSSAFMYVSRYAVNSWGILFLETHKGYSTLQASSIISVSSISGIVGNIISGFISDKFFKGKRNMPAFVFGVLNAVSLTLFLFNPKGNPWLDTLSMVLFGLATGVLICFLGGLMAVDIASKKAAGTAVGIVGIASYIGAAIQDIVSGLLIQKNKTIVDGVVHYNFTQISYLWIGAAIISFLLTLLVWNAKAKD
jgi:MFS transporter, OPA family, sugar phosphate sensor protein UhpC